MTPAAFKVARTRPGVMGASCIRTPVASKNALAIAPDDRARDRLTRAERRLIGPLDEDVRHLRASP